MSKKYGPVKNKVKAASLGAIITGIIAHQLQKWGVALDFEVLGVFSINELVIAAGAFAAGWLKKEVEPWVVKWSAS